MAQIDNFSILSPQGFDDNAVITAFSEAVGTPVGNLQDDQPKNVWKSLGLVGEFLEIDLGSVQEIQQIFLGPHNLTSAGTIRVRTADTQANLTAAPVSDVIFPALTEREGQVVELVTNGDFAADTDWAKGLGWSISGGVASCDGTQPTTTVISQANPATAVVGDQVVVTVTITSFTAGNFSFPGALTGLTRVSAFQLHAAIGTFQAIYEATATSVNVGVQGDTNFIGTIDNITATPVTKDTFPRGLGRFFINLATSLTNRFVRFDFLDAVNPDGFFCLGRAIIGKPFQPLGNGKVNPMAMGSLRFGPQDRSPRQTTISLGTVVNPKPKINTVGFRVQVLGESELLDGLDEINRVVGSSEAVLVAVQPSVVARRHKKLFYGLMTVTPYSFNLFTSQISRFGLDISLEEMI